MKKLILSLSAALFLVLTACGGADIYVEEVYYDDYGYMGDQVAGQSFSASHIELGIRSGNIFEVAPGSLQMSFDLSANFVSGNKNCNVFQANTVWYEFSLALDFTLIENQFCPIELIGFPEDVYLNDVFEIETYIELGRQVVVLYSEQQDVAVYLQ